MAGRAAPKLGLGTVIGYDDGRHEIWNGKQFVPARQDANGQWSVDSDAMTRMGLGGQGNPVPPGSPDEQKQVGEIRKDFQDVDGLANNATAFMQRNARTKTGGLLAIPGATLVAKALPGTSPDLGAMDRINNTMATQMRAPGMRLTQMEFGKFLGATPTPKNTREQNAQITADIYRARTIAAAKSAYYTNYLQTHRTLAGADAGWLAWRNKHFDPTLENYLPDDPKAAKNDQLKAKSAAAKGFQILDVQEPDQ